MAITADYVFTVTDLTLNATIKGTSPPEGGIQCH